jgi:branched-chain amino acid transport system substrate-binding protein
VSSADPDETLRVDPLRFEPVSLRSSSSPGRAFVALALSVGVTLAACTDDGADDPEPTVAPTTTTPDAPRIDDGRLVIGALYPIGDALIGPSITAAVEHAVDAIGAAGGVLGRPVELVVADEGNSAASAAAGIDTLLEAGADAIVGPSSSVIALAALDGILDAGLVSCSPSASALRLDDFPDDDGLFFRTIPSDSLQAVAIADVVENTGAVDTVVVHVDDSYGRPFAAATRTALDDRAVTVTATIAISPFDDDLGDEALALLESGVRTAVVLGTGDETGRFLDALGRTDFDDIRTIVVNDAARDAATRPIIAALEPGLRERVVGLAPQVVLPADTAESLFSQATAPDDDTESPPASDVATTTVDEDDDEINPFAGPFAAQVIDCVNLIGLAATQADSDAPVEIARQMSSVSSGGSVCRDFADCAADLEQRLQIDYNGPSGVTELGRDGDTTRAWFEVFDFDDEGRDRTVDTFQMAS